MDLISVSPIFNLYNMEWPILTLPEPLPPAKFVFAEDERMGHALDSMVSPGVIVSGATIDRSVISSRVHLHGRALVTDSVVFSGVNVGGGAIVRRAIIDKDVTIEPGAQIGVDPEVDRQRFTVSPSGIVVVPKGARVSAQASS
jgi:glucose-1-phosphate adenylyltransferase